MFNSNFRSRSEEGFTLIELLVVILIIGVLAAIALPIFMNQQRAAAAAAVKSDLKTVSSMAMLQKTKTGKYPTTCDEWKNIMGGWVASKSTAALGARVSDDGSSLWLEGQPFAANGTYADLTSSGVADYTMVYDSSSGLGVLSRNDFAAKTGTSNNVAAGYVTKGFFVNGLSSSPNCTQW